MKMKFRFRYDKFQEELIQRLHEETDAKFRIRADRAIEFAKKWYPVVNDTACDIRHEIFHKPVIRTWSESVPVSAFIHKLADKNIPFVIEDHNGTNLIIYDECDVEDITEILNSLGLGLVDLFNKKY
ncbi:hypothetical protein [uncultured Desulfobacter sp.]|uniref:hypothetical protein n=1 Tax=uncultured Desulfobacter sp. TaxID=240139 RepID=UPI0029F55BAE|nr:hypothetical protein [uncultured Desulfobacter sp.]